MNKKETVNVLPGYNHNFLDGANLFRYFVVIMGYFYKLFYTVNAEIRVSRSHNINMTFFKIFNEKRFKSELHNLIDFQCLAPQESRSELISYLKHILKLPEL